LYSKEKNFDILSYIRIGLGSGKELCMQCNLAKFIVNALSWQILEIRNFGCYRNP
jgi:hypothetical protein